MLLIKLSSIKNEENAATYLSHENRKNKMNKNSASFLTFVPTIGSSSLPR